MKIFFISLFFLLATTLSAQAMEWIKVLDSPSNKVFVHKDSIRFYKTGAVFWEMEEFGAYPKKLPSGIMRSVMTKHSMDFAKGTDALLVVVGYDGHMQSGRVIVRNSVKPGIQSLVYRTKAEEVMHAVEMMRKDNKS